jgi:hypothetical protein
MPWQGILRQTMKTIVKARHWQIFGLLIGIGCIQQLLDTLVIIGNLDKVISDVFYILFLATNIGWVLTTGISLNTRLECPNKTGLRIFIGTGLLLIIIPSIFRLSVTEDGVLDTVNSNTVFFGVFAYVISSLLFICGFTAKTLKRLETKNHIDINDYFSDIFLILFWPIGIWFIQPRVNRQFEDIQQGQNDNWTDGTGHNTGFV